jgi:hypothetical protein
MHRKYLHMHRESLNVSQRFRDHHAPMSLHDGTHGGQYLKLDCGRRCRACPRTTKEQGEGNAFLGGCSAIAAQLNAQKSMMARWVVEPPMRRTGHTTQGENRSLCHITPDRTRPDWPFTFLEGARIEHFERSEALAQGGPLAPQRRDDPRSDRYPPPLTSRGGAPRSKPLGNFAHDDARGARALGGL